MVSGEEKENGLFSPPPSEGHPLFDQLSANLKETLKIVRHMA